MLVKVCDNCNRVEDKIKTFFVVTGRGLDAAGDTDDLGENVDLCGACALSLITRIIYRRDYKLNSILLRMIKSLTPA
jgi:hypothetical protein